MQVKLLKTGDSIGTSFPKEVLDWLGLKDGISFSNSIDPAKTIGLISTAGENTQTNC